MHFEIKLFGINLYIFLKALLSWKRDCYVVKHFKKNTCLFTWQVQDELPLDGLGEVSWLLGSRFVKRLTDGIWLKILLGSTLVQFIH